MSVATPASAAPATEERRPSDFLSVLAAREHEPAADSPPTPDTPPEEARPEGAPPPDDAPDAGRPRDASGRFAPRQDTATDTPAEAPADPAPAEDAAATEPPAQPEGESEVTRLQRELASLRGQVTNAAKQAADKARAEERQRVRQETVTTLNALVQSGEYTRDQAQAVLAGKQAEWKAEDLAAKEQQFAQRDAEAQMATLGAFAQEVTGRLWERATPLLAETHGLPLADVRAFWDDPQERERYQRAALQMRLAQERPDLAANASALDDYLNTANNHFAHVATVTKRLTARYEGELAALRKERDDLQLKLNRADEGANPAYRQEAPNRGAPAARDDQELVKRGGYAALLDARDGLPARR